MCIEGEFSVLPKFLERQGSRHTCLLLEWQIRCTIHVNHLDMGEEGGGGGGCIWANPCIQGTEVFVSTSYRWCTFVPIALDNHYQEGTSDSAGCLWGAVLNNYNSKYMSAIRMLSRTLAQCTITLLASTYVINNQCIVEASLNWFLGPHSLAVHQNNCHCVPIQCGVSMLRLS